MWERNRRGLSEQEKNLCKLMPELANLYLCRSNASLKCYLLSLKIKSSLTFFEVEVRDSSRRKEKMFWEGKEEKSSQWSAQIRLKMDSKLHSAYFSPSSLTHTENLNSFYLHPLLTSMQLYTVCAIRKIVMRICISIQKQFISFKIYFT